jgi:hypothetical protein
LPQEKKPPRPGRYPGKTFSAKNFFGINPCAAAGEKSLGCGVGGGTKKRIHKHEILATIVEHVEQLFEVHNDTNSTDNIWVMASWCNNVRRTLAHKISKNYNVSNHCANVCFSLFHYFVRCNVYNYKEESVKRIRERIDRSGVPSDAIATVVRSQVYDLEKNTMNSTYTVKTNDGSTFQGSSLENAIAQYFRELATLVIKKQTKKTSRK